MELYRAQMYAFQYSSVLMTYPELSIELFSLLFPFEWCTAQVCTYSLLGDTCVWSWKVFLNLEVQNALKCTGRSVGRNTKTLAFFSCLYRFTTTARIFYGPYRKNCLNILVPKKCLIVQIGFGVEKILQFKVLNTNLECRRQQWKNSWSRHDHWRSGFSIQSV